MDSTTIIIVFATIIASWYACYRAYKNKQAIEEIKDFNNRVSETIQQHANIINDHSEIINATVDVLEDQKGALINVAKHSAETAIKLKNMNKSQKTKKKI